MVCLWNDRAICWEVCQGLLCMHQWQGITFMILFVDGIPVLWNSGYWRILSLFWVLIPGICHTVYGLCRSTLWGCLPERTEWCAVLNQLGRSSLLTKDAWCKKLVDQSLHLEINRLLSFFAGVVHETCWISRALDIDHLFDYQDKKMWLSAPTWNRICSQELPISPLRLDWVLKVGISRQFLFGLNFSCEMLTLSENGSCVWRYPDCLVCCNWYQVSRRSTPLVSWVPMSKRLWSQWSQNSVVLLNLEWNLLQKTLNHHIASPLEH